MVRKKFQNLGWKIVKSTRISNATQKVKISVFLAIFVRQCKTRGLGLMRQCSRHRQRHTNKYNYTWVTNHWVVVLA